tara:strand:+ start:171 stop:875 length:705 start_codon:yes stop_codon:yes gene_type:complete
MALPILESNRYFCDLPVSKEKIEYRPFLVKEQKILLTALESEDMNEVNHSILDLLRNCVLNEVNFDKLPISDIEYLFIQLRIKSVGETSDIKLACQNCEEFNDIVVNLDEISLDGEIKDGVINLTDSVSIKFRAPSFKDLPTDTNVDNADIESIFEIMRNCVECITQGEEVFTHDDFNHNELQEFFDNLNTDQFTEIQQFFVDIPRVKSVVNFNCSKCDHQNERELAGLQDFFV